MAMAAEAPCGAGEEKRLSGWDDEFRAGLAELLHWRRDVRRFRTAPLDRALLAELLGVAALAPSVGNAQPWRFVIVDHAARRTQIVSIFERENAEAALGYEGERRALYCAMKLAGLREAPVHLAVFCDEETGRGAGLGRQTMPETLRYSVVCAIHTLWLAARARGVALGWVSILDPAAVRTVLDVPASWSLIGYLCLGWPDEVADRPELERQGWERRATPDTFLLQR
jgi:5,6-dimethylbenzimidazole synthase